MAIQEKPKNFTSQFSVIWFYDCSHVALEIDNIFYNPFWRCIETENADTTQRKRTLEGSGEPYYQFHIGLSPEEKQQLLKEWKDLGVHTCSGNAARLVTKVTGISFPWFQSWVPANFAKSLYERHSTDSRILSIEHVGKTPAPKIEKVISQKKWEEWDSFFKSFQILLSILFLGALEFWLKKSLQAPAFQE